MCDLHVLLLQWNMTMWIPESCKLPWRQSASKGCTWQARSMAPLDMKRLLRKGWLRGLMQLPQVSALPVPLCTFSLLRHSASQLVTTFCAHLRCQAESRHTHVDTCTSSSTWPCVAFHCVRGLRHISLASPMCLTLDKQINHEVLLQRNH